MMYDYFIRFATSFTFPMGIKISYLVERTWCDEARDFNVEELESNPTRDKLIVDCKLWILPSETSTAAGQEIDFKTLSGPELNISLKEIKDNVSSRNSSVWFAIQTTNEEVTKENHMKVQQYRIICTKLACLRKSDLLLQFCHHINNGQIMLIRNNQQLIPCKPKPHNIQKKNVPVNNRSKRPENR